MISGKTETISPERWEKERVGMISTSARSFGDLKTAIIQFCNKNPSMCSFAREELKKTHTTLTNIEKVGGKK